MAVDAKELMQWQERLANTAHVREIEDLKAAGLNPVLSAGGSGAAVPSGAMDPVTQASSGSGRGSGHSASQNLVKTINRENRKTINLNAKLIGEAVQRGFEQANKKYESQGRSQAAPTGAEYNAAMGELLSRTDKQGEPLLYQDDKGALRANVYKEMPESTAQVLSWAFKVAPWLIPGGKAGSALVTKALGSAGAGKALTAKNIQMAWRKLSSSAKAQSSKRSLEEISPYFLTGF